MVNEFKLRLEKSVSLQKEMPIRLLYESMVIYYFI